MNSPLRAEERELGASGDGQAGSRDERPRVSAHESTTETNAPRRTRKRRQAFDFLSLRGISFVVGSTWPFIGGYVIATVFSGSGLEALIDFVCLCLFCWNLRASIAELTNTLPASAAVYNWAPFVKDVNSRRMSAISIPSKLNCGVWVLLTSTLTSVFANVVVQIYSATHLAFIAKSWHVFLVYIVFTWMACVYICFANSQIRVLTIFGPMLLAAFFVATIVVVAVTPYVQDSLEGALSLSVWTDWPASIGDPDELLFVAALLNGAYTTGAVTAAARLAKHYRDTANKPPLWLTLRLFVGFVAGNSYLIFLVCSVQNFGTVWESERPIAEIYQQATASATGACGILSLTIACIGLTAFGLHINCARSLWTFKRQWSAILSASHGRSSTTSPPIVTPIITTLISASAVTILGGVLFIGTATVFNFSVSMVILLISTYYTGHIARYLQSGRMNFDCGLFRIRGAAGFAFNVLSCVYMLFRAGMLVGYAVMGSTDPKDIIQIGWAWGGLGIIMLTSAAIGRLRARATKSAVTKERGIGVV